MSAILSQAKRKEAYLKAEQSMGFLKDFNLSDDFCDESADTHALFQCRAQAKHLVKLLVELCPHRSFPTFKRECDFCWREIKEEVIKDA